MGLKVLLRGRKRHIAAPEVRAREAARDDPIAAREWLDQQAAEAGWVWAQGAEGMAARGRRG